MIYCFPGQIPCAKGWRGVKLQLIMEYVVMEIIFNSFDPKTITNIVHDRFLDAENIIWDKNSHHISFSYFSDPRGKVLEGVLLLKNVVDLFFADKEKIQYYDINLLKWIEKEKKISIITNVPLLFCVVVERFEMIITTV